MPVATIKDLQDFMAERGHCACDLTSTPQLWLVWEGHKEKAPSQERPHNGSFKL